MSTQIAAVNSCDIQPYVSVSVVLHLWNWSLFKPVSCQLSCCTGGIEFPPENPPSSLLWEKWWWLGKELETCLREIAQNSHTQCCYILLSLWGKAWPPEIVMWKNNTFEVCSYSHFLAIWKQSLVYQFVLRLMSQLLSVTALPSWYSLEFRRALFDFRWPTILLSQKVMCISGIRSGGKSLQMNFEILNLL